MLRSVGLSGLVALSAVSLCLYRKSGVFIARCLNFLQGCRDILNQSFHVPHYTAYDGAIVCTNMSCDKADSLVNKNDMTECNSAMGRYFMIL